MRRMRYQELAAFCTTIPLATAMVALAAPKEGDAEKATPPGLSLEEMSARLGELEKRNSALQGQVNELEAADGESWVSGQRAQQIREVVTDVLADAETRVSLQSSGMTAGWDDGFFLQSPDGRFRLNVGGMLQARFLYSSLRESYDAPGTNPGPTSFADSVGSRSGFDIANARLDFNGNVFGQSTRYRIMGEFANQRGEVIEPYNTSVVASGPDAQNNSGSFRLLDAWVAHDFVPGFSIRAGQFKLPFDRGWQVPIKYQLTGERSSVAQHMGVGRSQGVELRWTSETLRVRGALSDGGTDRLLYDYYLAGTNPSNSPWWYQQASWALSGRMEWKISGSWADFAKMTCPPGDDFSVMLGGGVHAQQNKIFNGQDAYTQGDNDTNTWVGVTGDVTMNFGGASVTGAVYYHNLSGKSTIPVQNYQTPGAPATNPTYDVGNTQMLGISLYGSVYVASEFELFAGYELMDIVGNDLNTLAGTQPVNIYSDPSPYNALNFGTNWYIDGEDMKFTFAFTYMFGKADFGWTTLSNGVRGTPVSDSFAIRTQLQLLF